LGVSPAYQISSKSQMVMSDDCVDLAWIHPIVGVNQSDIWANVSLA